MDAMLDGIASAGVGLLRLLTRLVLLTLKGMFLLLRGIVLVVTWPARAIFRLVTGSDLRAEQCSRLTGVEFEDYAADVLRGNGYRHVEMTAGSGDQGVDILCTRGGRRFAVQCKNYAGAVGNFAVQEAYAGMQYYDCDVAVVLCPGTFTSGARELAEATGVLLWDGKTLTRMMRRSGRRPHHRRQAGKV